MNDSAPLERVTVGHVVKPHGLRGTLVVESCSNVAGRFEGLTEVWLEAAEGGDERRPVIQVAPFGKRYLVELAGVEGRDAAEALRGRALKIDAPIESGDDIDEPFFHQLVGLQVFHVQSGDLLGEVVEVMETGANEVLVVRPSSGHDILVPYIDAVIRAVNTAEGRLTIEPLPGLLDG